MGISTEKKNFGKAAAKCDSNNDKKSFTTTKFASNSLLINCFILIFVVSLPGKLLTANLPNKKGAVVIRNDLLCNLESEYECICNRSKGNLDNSEYLPCHKFIQGKQLEVVSIVMRGINLNSMLHTNETYEQYLRRRIARILSQYCDNMPTECPGTLADDLRLSSNLVEINNRTTAVIYDEPVFSRESIAILRVTFPPGKARTEIAFAVVKRTNTFQLNTATTFDPTKVKYILSAQIAPLSRVLGGIRIEQFGIEMVEKPNELVDNTKLLIMIGVIGISMVFCCTIAAIRQICLLREARRRMKRQNQSSSAAAEEEKKGTRNYGTCTEKFFTNYDLTNGHVKSKSLCSRDSMNSSKKTKRGKKMSKCSSEAPPGPVLADRTLTEEPSPRPYQNIFICDHSQLPKEGIDDEFEIEIQRLKRQNLQVRSPRSPFSSDDDGIAGGFQGFQFPERSPTEKSVDKRLSISDNIPSVVLNDEQNEAELPFEKQRQNERNQSPAKGSAFLNAISEDHPFERPLSRRGSINEMEQEEGEEGTNNDEGREETPDPLGDEHQQQQQAEGREKEKPLLIVLRRNNRERAIPSESGTDEAEEEEEEETDEEDALYQPLKEEEWPSRGRMSKGKGKDRGGQRTSSEGNGTKEKAMLDRHHYERLLESSAVGRHDTSKIRNNATPKIILND
ncbi:hypothetical protein niasHT_039758 [Heterodera trifolii]|uniref:Uncharacterized protein n=1 Tax=Heterodera trifolii TaxID=157864 RepID=A0ABD2IUV3_9BILA